MCSLRLVPLLDEIVCELLDNVGRGARLDRVGVMGNEDALLCLDANYTFFALEWCQCLLQSFMTWISAPRG